MPYSTDADLLKIRPKILSYNVAAWTDQRTEAETKIDKVIETQWYRPEANHLGVNWREYPFDQALMLEADEQLKTLSCYKCFELIYLYLMKDSPEEDAFERQHKLFKRLYADELRSVLATGINYDWDESGVLASVEKNRPSRRRLRRC